MNNLIDDIVKKSQDDESSSFKLINHFNTMIDKFIAAQSLLIDHIQGMKTRDLSVREARNKCITACQNMKTDICDKMPFIQNTNTAYSKSQVDGVQLNYFNRSYIWYKANAFVRKLMGDNVNLADPSVEDQATKTNLVQYKDLAQAVANLIIKYQQGLESDKLDFSKVLPYPFSAKEKVIYSKYTDKTCAEAEDAHNRFILLAKYYTMFLVFLILLILALCCCGCLTCVQLRRKRDLNDFFGHNNGEDNL